MPLCKKCEEPFSRRYIDESGKVFNLQRRKYCFKCSPFNQHNTKQLDIFDNDRICRICDKPFKSNRRRICQSCNTNIQRQNKKLFLMSIVGYNCWNCNYGGESKYFPLLDMHHVNPSNKKFQLSSTYIATLSNEEIVEEAKKCILLCNRCHMEYHYEIGTISNNKILKLHKKWNSIVIPK